jgi:hypothetical protein
VTDREIPSRPEGEVGIRLFAKVEFATVIASWETALALEPFHIWRRDVVRERFDYDEAPGVHFAFIRAFRLSQPWIIPDRPSHGGCRSWVNLPPRDDLAMDPVLSDDEHTRRLRDIRALLDPATTR